MQESGKPTDETLRIEYTAAQEDYMHNDNFIWQMGAILVAGAFVFWGLLLDKQIEPRILGVSSLLVASLVSVWILYVHHYRQIYLCKLHRMHEIERFLGMQLHRRWVENPPGEQKPFYYVFGPRGRTMNFIIYCFVSLGAPLIGLFKVGANLWLGLPMPLIVAVSIWVYRNERNTKELLDRRTKATWANAA